MAAKWKIINTERKSLKRQMEPNVKERREKRAKENSDPGNELENILK